jgi:hypothetical protein
MIATPAQFPFRTVARWLLVCITIYIVGWLLWSARSALTPFLVGLVLAYLLLPLVSHPDRLPDRSQLPGDLLLVYLPAADRPDPPASSLDPLAGDAAGLDRPGRGRV